MPAADARLTNTTYPIPETFKDYSVSDLLTAAAYGRVGVDKRFIQAVLDHPQIIGRDPEIRFQFQRLLRIG